MELYPIAVSQLHYDEAAQFIIRLFEDVNTLKSDLGKDPDMQHYFNTLHAQSENFDQALKQIKAHEETKELEKLDLIRDKKLITLRRQISVAQHSDEKEEQHAYAVAMIIMKKYTGLERTNFEAETFGIKKLLEEWKKPENAENIKTLGLQRNLDNLQKAADNFTALFGQRSGETTQKETYDCLALKRQMLDTYDKLAKYVLSMIAVKKENEFYLDVIAAFNNGRHYFADLMAIREGRRAAEKKEEKEGDS